MLQDNREIQPQVSPIIAVPFWEEKRSLDVRQLNVLQSDMESYDEAYGISGMVLGIIFSTMRDEGLTERNTPTLEKLTSRHNVLMETMGLSFEPVSGKRATMFSPGQQTPDSQMRLNVKNRKQFLQFLRQIEKDHVALFELDGSFSSISTSLINQLVDHYDLQSPTDEALELVASLENITNEYKRLGLEDDSNTLAEYTHHMKQKSLREFVMLTRSGLMQKPADGYGPGDWHRDTSLQNYTNRWRGALEMLKYINTNPNARPLFEELYTHIETCIHYARTTID